MLSPNKLFTIYEKGYKSNYVETTESNHVIDLFPIESNEFKNIQIQVDINKIQLKKIILFDKNGGSFSYVITRFETNNDLASELFKFNVEDYNDVEIIDLR